MSRLVAALVAVLPLAAAFPAPAPYQCKKGQQIPINFSFGASVPVVNNANQLPYLQYNGYYWQLPKETLSGLAVSFLANYNNNGGTDSQISTISHSTSIHGGDSYSNGSATANGTTLVALSYSSGNSSSAVVAAQNSGSQTSTSSSGAANSTAIAVADAQGVVSIATSANTVSAADQQSLDNAQQAAAASSCAADNESATSSAELDTTVQYTTTNGTQFTSMAYAACSAGFMGPSTNSSASSGSQASVYGVSSTVTCDGITSTQQTQSTLFKLSVQGIYTCGAGFDGAITGQRVAKSSSSC